MHFMGHVLMRACVCLCVGMCVCVCARVSPLIFLNQYVSWVMCCGGASICEHSRVRGICMDCGDASICVHRRVRSRCKDYKRLPADLASAGSQL